MKKMFLKTFVQLTCDRKNPQPDLFPAFFSDILLQNLSEDTFNVRSGNCKINLLI